MVENLKSVWRRNNNIRGNRGLIMANPIEQQIKTELLSEIEAAEKNYVTIKDVLSGAQYDVTDVKGILQSFKDNLSKVSFSFIMLSQRYSKDAKPSQIPIDSFLGA